MMVGVCVPLNTGGPGLSVVVNAAGITRDKTLLKMSEEAFDEVIKVNLKVHNIHLKLGCMSGNMVGDWQTNSSVWNKDIVSHSLCALVLFVLCPCQGTFLVSQAAARLMVENKVTNGSIVNIASITGKVHINRTGFKKLLYTPSVYTAGQLWPGELQCV